MHKRTKAGIFLAFFASFCIYFFVCPQQAFAQYTDTTAVSDTIAKFHPETPSRMITKQHSPKKAMLMSTFLPGLGQAYNKQYWKIPIIYAGAAVVTYFAIDNYRGAQKFLKEYKYRVDGDSSNFNPSYLGYPDNSILNLYNAYEKNFELSLIIGGFVYLLNILDAYVFAHLFTFDINEDISMQMIPTINYPAVSSVYKPSGLSLSLKFTFK